MSAYTWIEHATHINYNGLQKLVYTTVRSSEGSALAPVLRIRFIAFYLAAAAFMIT
jgi:hypothetical protein